MHTSYSMLYCAKDDFNDFIGISSPSSSTIFSDPNKDFNALSLNTIFSALTSKEDLKVHITSNASMMNVKNNFSSFKVVSNHHPSFSNIEKCVYERYLFNELSFVKCLGDNFDEISSIHSSDFSSTSKVNPSSVLYSCELELSPLPSTHDEILFETPSTSEEVLSDDNDSSLEDWVNSPDLLDEPYLTSSSFKRN